MTCNANHPPIEHSEATCPLCEMLVLCHEQEHELYTLRAEIRESHVWLDKLEAQILKLVGTDNGHPDSNGTRDDANVPT